MKNADPLTILTYMIGVGLLLILGRFAVTGQLSVELLGAMGTIVGSLVTALATRPKKQLDETKKEEGEDDAGNK